MSVQAVIDAAAAKRFKARFRRQPCRLSIEPVWLPFCRTFQCSVSIEIEYMNSRCPREWAQSLDTGGFMGGEMLTDV